MKVLLDTHIWLWHLLGDRRLKPAHRKIMANSASEIWLSSVSVWEAHLLIERKRLRIAMPAPRWISQALAGYPVREAPVTFAIAIRSRAVRLPHGDPADRFIVATAAEMKLPLLTADLTLLACPDVTCV